MPTTENPGHSFLRTRTKVLPGKRLEAVMPELQEGADVELIVMEVEGAAVIDAETIVCCQSLSAQEQQEEAAWAKSAGRAAQKVWRHHLFTFFLLALRHLWDEQQSTRLHSVENR